MIPKIVEFFTPASPEMFAVNDSGGYCVCITEHRSSAEKVLDRVKHGDERFAR
jgi:hypothetical protein